MSQHLRSHLTLFTYGLVTHPSAVINYALRVTGPARDKIYHKIDFLLEKVKLPFSMPNSPFSRATCLELINYFITLKTYDYDKLELEHELYQKYVNKVGSLQPEQPNDQESRIMHRCWCYDTTTDRPTFPSNKKRIDFEDKKGLGFQLLWAAVTELGDTRITKFEYLAIVKQGMELVGAVFPS